MKSAQYLLALVILVSVFMSNTARGGNKPILNKANKAPAFIENKGQWDKEVLFQCRLANMDVWITKTGVNYTWYKIKPDTTKPKKTERNPKLDYLAHVNDSVLIHRVIMDYAGANANPRGEGKLKQEAYYNYFIGTDTTKHASFVGLYQEVIVHDVYPHIDIRYYIERGKLRYDYVVNPGGDPKQIRFQYRGQDGEAVRNNQLLLNTRFGEVAVRDLYCYQDKQAIPGEFVKQGKYWQFALGEYDTQKPLIIDPLIYSTFLGGSNNESGNDIDIDNLGNTYVVGNTFSINYQVTIGAYNTTFGGSSDIFVSKLNSSGTNLIFSTYVGGNFTDGGTALKVDTAGCIYFTGFNFIGNYPVTPGAYQLNNSSLSIPNQPLSLSEVIITKLNAAGSSLLYSTYLGGSFDDYGYDIDVDQFGFAYVCGYSMHFSGPTFDVTPGAYFFPGISSDGEVGFATKINQTGTNLVYSSVLGGSFSYTAAIKVNSQGEAFVVGVNDPYNFPITYGAYTNNIMGSGLFVQRLNAAGSGIIYSLSIRTNQYNYPYNLEIDNDDNAIITGYSPATNFPMTPGAFQAIQAGWFNKGFIMKFNNVGGLLFSSTIDGFQIRDFDLDNQGNILAVGYTYINNLPTTPGAYQTVKDSVEDIYMLKLSSNGSSLIYATYLGGSGGDIGYGICMDSLGVAYITGSTSSTNYDLTPNAFDTTFNGGEDVFITKLDPCASMTVSAASTSPLLCIQDTFPMIYHTCTGAYSLGTPVNFPPGLSATLSNDSIIISGTPLLGGIYNYQIPLLGSCGNIAATGTISISPYAQLSSAPGTNNQYVCINAPISSITYALNGGINGVIISGLPSGVTGTSSNGIVTISGTPTVLGNFMYQITVYDVCDTTSIYGSIFVGPTTASLSSLTGTDSQTVCINTMITPITYVTNGAIGVVFNGLPSGVFGTFNNDTISIVGIPLMPGNYTYTIVLTGGCINDTIQGNIMVNPTTTIVLSQGIGQSVSVCVNSPIPNQVFTSTGATGAIYNNLPPGVTGSFNNGIIVLSGSPTVSGTYNTSIQLTGGCNTASMNRLFYVLPITNVNLSSGVGSDSQQVCVNTPINNITYTSTGVYSVLFSGLPQGVWGNLSNGNITIGGSPLVAGNYTYTVMPYLSSGCGSVSVSGQIQVKPNSAISLSSAVGSDSQLVCINSTIANITYNATGATGAIFSGLPPGVTGSFSNGNVLISGTPTSVGVFPYMVLLTGECDSVIASGQIQVKPNNTISLSSAVGSDSQLVCINSPITNITYTVSGATGAVFSGLPNGVVGSYNNGNVLISGTPTSVGVFPYSILLTGGCGSVSASGQIQVKPNSNISLSSTVGSDSQQVCINSPIANITYNAIGATGAVFSGLPPGIISNFNNGNIFIIGTPTISGNYPYSILLTGGCDSMSAIGYIQVNPNNTIGLSSPVGSDTQQVCVNTSITNITYTTTGATGAVFNGLPPGIMGSFNNGNIDISGTPNTVGYFNYSVDLSGGCGAVSQMGILDVRLCTGLQEHEASEFSVYPNPTKNSFTLVSKDGGDYILTDVSGKKIREYRLTTRQQTIRENLAAGMYFLREVESGRVIRLVFE